MRTVLGVVDWATSALALIAGIGVTLMMLHVTIDVVMRSGFGIALPGTITIVSNYYMIFLVCLPLAFVERKNNHIMVDVFTNQLSEKVTRPLFGWTFLLSGIAFGLIAYGSWVEALTQFKVMKFTIEQDISIPTWIGYFAVPLGYGMGTIYVLLKFVRFLMGFAPMAAVHDTDHEVESLGHD